MSGLFIKKGSEGPARRRRAEAGNVEVTSLKKKQRKGASLREEIESDSDTEIVPVRQKPQEDEEDIEETAQEKKLRLAKEYLKQLQEQEEERQEDENQDLIGSRLQEDVLEQRGKLQRPLAKELVPPEPSEIRLLRGHQGPITCLVITPDDQHVFSGSKDCSIIKWSTCDGKKVHKIPGGRKGSEDKHVGHTGHILCMAVSSDGKYLASGDRNKLIFIWNAETCQNLHKFQGHRDAVSGLSFQKGKHQLFSASHDRSVKVWNVAENSYIETLFGHQDSITGLDSLSRERCVTSGGRDGTVRVWKIAEESQLVFSGHEGSIDCIRLINEEHMVSGAEDGSLALWSVSRKKPLARVKCAHGQHGNPGLEQPYWISSVSAALNSDVVASGSNDGNVRLWRCGEGFRGLHPLCTIPLVGSVNSLQFSSTADFLVAGVGQEHRLGRWWRIKEAKNGLYIIPFKRKLPLSEGS
ncbi:U3 small nucleolar RNA-interacting 2 isoform X2 [Pelobates cultripes]|uniref:U3 small nucleolar RNA-interacting protein 2 n=1 Tax=Pelobates cultripes TaxID=61616 RepID=A0AAD1SYA4_PELCU|nr:U3 small nucleolar RNA-interacting 2 isoform X2 [Pelobates cultripes]